MQQTDPGRHAKGGDMNTRMAGLMFRIHERLLGRDTFKILGQLTRSQFLPRERIEKIRLSRFKSLVASAYEYCPYWRQVMNKVGLHPQDVRSLDALKAFPLLTKEDIRRDRERMVWRDEGRGVHIAKTTGSTNARLDFYTSASRESHITAARMRGHRWVGVEPGDKEMYFWAAPLELAVQDRIRQLRDWLRNDAFTNGLMITPRLARECVEKWAAWRPRCVFGYVSSFTTLVRLATQEKLDLTRFADLGLKAIITTSELLGESRKTISDAFGVPVFDSYGLRESGLIGHDCSHFTMHTNDEQLLLETVDPHTLEPTDGEGELVVTMLASRVMPVIRYRTGDLVTLGSASCPCGVSLGSIKMSGGRIMECIVTSEGNWISAVSLIYTCRAVPGLRQLQARQDRIGEVKLLVALEEDAPPDAMDRVATLMRQRLDSKDSILLERVSEIPPAPSGKQMMVVSKVTHL
jgi:phenylacetate-CoA ligase